MRMLAISFCLSLLWAPAVHASDEGVDAAVAEIRALYGQVGPSDDLLCFDRSCLEAETTFVRMMPGTGPQQTQVRFFFAEHLPDEEQIYPEAYLRKAVVRYNIAAQEYYVEYLFSGVEPKLVFHFQSDALTERRTWIKDGEAIRIDVRPKGKPDEKTVRDQGFSALEIGHVRSTWDRAAELVTLFGSMVKTADGEMGGWLYEDE